MAEFALSRDPFGRLVLRDAAGIEHVGVVPVRAFPIGAPDEGLSLVSADGRRCEDCRGAGYPRGAGLDVCCLEWLPWP